MLSADAAAKANCVGCMAIARTDFLWYVRVPIVLPLRRSHILIILSCDPVITCAPRSVVLHKLNAARKLPR